MHSPQVHSSVKFHVCAHLHNHLQDQYIKPSCLQKAPLCSFPATVHFLPRVSNILTLIITDLSLVLGLYINGIIKCALWGLASSTQCTLEIHQCCCSYQQIILFYCSVGFHLTAKSQGGCVSSCGRTFGWFPVQAMTNEAAVDLSLNFLVTLCSFRWAGTSCGPAIVGTLSSDCINLCVVF